MLMGCSQKPAPTPKPTTPTQNPVPIQAAPVQQTQVPQKSIDDEQKRIQERYQTQIQAQEQARLQAQAEQQRQMNAPPVNGMKTYEKYRDNVYESTFPGYKAEKDRQIQEARRERMIREKAFRDGQDAEYYHKGFNAGANDARNRPALPVNPR